MNQAESPTSLLERMIPTGEVGRAWAEVRGVPH